jgi:hypothetical protein
MPLNNLKRAAVLLALSVLALGLGTQQARAEDGGTRTYEITITNLTTGQTFSPPVFATHTSSANVFTTGRKASEGIRLIAEQGSNATLASTLRGAPGVSRVVAGDMPVHRIGGAGSIMQTFMIEADGSANWLSMAAMLICTNDGFVGLNSVKLPETMTSVVYYARGYDAGTEVNDQLYTHLGDPCVQVGPVKVDPDGMNLRTPENGVIMPHRGTVANVGDQGKYADAYSWPEPAAKIIIRRVK